MLLGVKFSPGIKKQDFHMLDFLENEGVVVSGVELQLFPEKTMEEVLDTLDALKSYNLKFVGIHPPFPSFRKELDPWKDLPVDYFVLHAGTHRGYSDLLSDLRVEKAFVENLYSVDKPGFRLCSLIEIGFVSDSLLVDIAHLLYSYQKRLYWMPPWDQVRAVGKKIKAVHAADGFEGKGVVPQNGGTPEFRVLLKSLFEVAPNAYYVGEPYGGHLNGNKGHIENALAFWNLWNEFKDGEL